MVTYLMALGSFTPHRSLGSAEVGYPGVRARNRLVRVPAGFALPTLGGNIVGGSLIFAPDRSCADP